MGRSSTKARTPAQQENILLNLATKLAEQKLRDGTASSQLICQVLALGSEKKQLENEKLKAEVAVANAKIKQMDESTSNGELYQAALNAFKKYSGQAVDEEDEYDD